MWPYNEEELEFINGEKMTHTPKTFGDRVAYKLTGFFRFFADSFFRKRYGHRAVVLETVAAVPGMVGGAMNHYRLLRNLMKGRDWVEELIEEALNERMHLIAFLEYSRPSPLERLLIIAAQFFFIVFYTFLYTFFPKIAHRMIGYFEEQAVVSYTEFLNEIDNGKIENVKAPQIAIDYKPWKLDENSTLRDLVIAVRTDEEGHRDRNHEMADELFQKR